LNFLKYKSNTKRYLESLPKKKDSGFTLVETLIAITLISLIGIPVFMVFSETLGFTDKIKDLNRWNKELIQLENVLRQSVSEVKVPFWISDIELTEEAGVMSVPYWDGNADSFLEIEIEDTILKISTPLGSTIFKGYEGFEVNFLKDSGSGTIGLSILVKKNKKENITFQCAFGSIGRDLFNE
jgi:prepilin-type N-terminal cleavage/methylation domain-containing protein